MSTPMEDLSRSLGVVGDSDLIGIVSRLAQLTTEQKQAITHFITESTPTDVNEASSVYSLLRYKSVEGESHASFLYEENNPTLRFLASLRGHTSVILRDDDLRVEIANPETDIEVESFTSIGLQDNEYIATFLVTFTVTGRGSKMSFKAHANVLDCMSKDITVWLEELTIQCRACYTEHPTFSGGTRLLGGDNQIVDFLYNPSKEKYEGVKNYFLLLEYFLGDFKIDPVSYVSRQVQGVVDSLISKIAHFCHTKQHISYELGEYLMDLSPILGFTTEAECIVMKDVSAQGQTKNRIILVKSPHAGWVWGSRNHPAYERVLLAEKLTK